MIVKKSPIEACPDAPPTNLAQLKGNMMLIKRGGCSFLEKAIVAQNSGVIGAIIFNNEVDDVDSNIDMVDDGSEQSHLVDIPIVWLQGKNGHMILNSIYKHGVSKIAEKELTFANCFLTVFRWLPVCLSRTTILIRFLRTKRRGISGELIYKKEQHQKDLFC